MDKRGPCRGWLATSGQLTREKRRGAAIPPNGGTAAPGYPFGLVVRQLFGVLGTHSLTEGSVPWLLW